MADNIGEGNPESVNQAEILRAAFESDLPHLWANGFLIGWGNSDVTVVLQQVGKPIATLNLSFTLAKTLSIKLADVIRDIEELSEQEIMTTEKVDSFRLKKAKPNTD